MFSDYLIDLRVLQGGFLIREDSFFVNQNQCWEDVTVLRNLKGSRELLRLRFLFWLKAIGQRL